MKSLSQRYEIAEFIKEQYGDDPEYLWVKTPECAVFRHQSNQKWYALIMTVPYNKLGEKSSQAVDIINLKCDHITIGSLLDEKGFYPAYHMNKTHWITIVLDESVDTQKIKALIDISYELTDLKLKKSSADKIICNQ